MESESPTSARVCGSGLRFSNDNVLIADFALFGIVSHTLSYVVVASSAPDVERQFKADNEDAFVDLSSPVTKSMLPADAIQRRIDFGIIVWRIYWSAIS